ncbi:MAG TPA: S41 family peptidase [Gemmatimonadaceae bacterium]
MAYIVVGSWSPSSFSMPDLDAVVDQFRDAPGMIIEVRPNGGGDDALALALAGRFANAPTTIGYVPYRDGPRHDDLGAEIVRRVSPRGAFQFTRPVVVLSGRGVYSSTDTFISAMREMPNVTVLAIPPVEQAAAPASIRPGDGHQISTGTSSARSGRPARPSCSHTH